MSTFQKTFKFNKSIAKALGLSPDILKQPTFNLDNIAELMRQAKENGNPYILLTGAGCSKSAGVPLADKLVTEMNDDFDVQLSNLSKEDRSNYNKCMNALTHQERRQLLQDHIRKAKINWAHIGLASLMDKQYVQRVLTFNFDNILMRACGLIGLYPAIYDFTNADVNLQNLIIDPSIIYLHGQSYGFRQLNDENETKNHANNMTNFIAQTLNTSPVIIAGYSGDNNGFFEQIDKHYCGEQRLFWIGYNENIPEHLQEFFKKYKNHAHYIGGQDADDFFVSLMQKLECSPEFFTRHAQHTIKVLDEVIDFPLPNTDDGINILSDLRQQMINVGQQALSLIAKVHSLMVEGNYNQVIEDVETSYGEIVANKNFEGMDEEIKFIYSWAKISKAKEDWSELKSKDFEKDDELIQSIFENFEKAVLMQPDMYELYLSWGQILTEIAYQTGESKFYKDSIEKFVKADEINPSAPAVNHLWGASLLMLADLEGDNSYNIEALDRLKIAEKSLPEHVYNLACAQIRFNNLEEAKNKLTFCKENKTLPPKEIMLSDSDMNVFFGTEWFAKLIGNIE